MSEIIYGAGLKDMRAEDAGALERLVLDTLESVAQGGVEPDDVEAALHQIEVQEMEIEGHGLPYGWVLAYRALGPWLQGSDFLRALDSTPRIRRLRQAALQGDFVPGLIRRWLLDNPHRVTVLVSPVTRQSVIFGGAATPTT